MQQHADYHLRRAEHLGDLEIAMPFKIFEDNNLSRLGTKRRNRPPDLILKLAIDLLGFRTWLGAMRRIKCDLFYRHRARAGPAAQQIERRINCGAVEIAARAGRKIKL